MGQAKQYVVITGDLKGSRRLTTSQVSELFRSLNELWDQFGKSHNATVVGHLEIFRGDGWQCALVDPSLAVHAALFLRASVKAHGPIPHMDTRIGVGIGTVDFLDSNQLGASNGPAFQLSGKALDSLSQSSLGWAFLREKESPDCLSSIGFPLMDLSVQRWSKAEGVAVVGSLLGLTQAEIAAHPLALKQDGQPPTQQAVADALKRIDWKSHWLPVLADFKKLLGMDKLKTSS